MSNVILDVRLIERDDGNWNVVCRACKKVLDVVPDKRTAYCRAGGYGEHRCYSDTQPSS